MNEKPDTVSENSPASMRATSVTSAMYTVIATDSVIATVQSSGHPTADAASRYTRPRHTPMSAADAAIRL